MPVPDDSPSGESIYDAVQQQPFSPFEPEPVQPTSTGPAPSSTTPGDFGGTSGEDGEPHTEPQAKEEKPLPKFDERHKEPFEGLMYLGRLEDTFTLWGHQFVIRSLTTEELTEIALLVKPYIGTRGENAAYQSAVIAASVERVDGRPLPQPLSGHDSGLSYRVEWVNHNWMPAVREVLWQKVYALEGKVREVLAAMGEPSG